MKKLLKIDLLIAFVLLFCVSAFAETNAQIEKELVAAAKEISKHSAYGGAYDDAKLIAANNAFEALLLKHTKTAATLSYNFPELKKSVFIATSEDKKFRVYSWDTETGGTMHEYARLYQYAGADGKIYSRGEPTADVDGGAGSFVYDVFGLDTKRGKVYIVCSNFIASTNDHYQAANLFKISGDKLEEKLKLIKTREGITDSLSFEYNFFSVVDRKERPIRLIKYDAKTKTLRIPIVINDTEFPNGRVTNRFINYRFDGSYFVKAG